MLIFKKNLNHNLFINIIKIMVYFFSILIILIIVLYGSLFNELCPNCAKSIYSFFETVEAVRKEFSTLCHLLCPDMTNSSFFIFSIIYCNTFFGFCVVFLSIFTSKYYINNFFIFETNIQQTYKINYFWFYKLFMIYKYFKQLNAGMYILPYRFH